jgi:septal ring factor EnvC (AmiA/AmiB activator)
LIFCVFGCLFFQVTGLQTQNSLLTSVHDQQKSEIAALKSTGKKDRDLVASLQREVASLRDKMTLMCQDKEELCNDVAKVQAELTRVRDFNNTLQVQLKEFRLIFRLGQTLVLFACNNRTVFHVSCIGPFSCWRGREITNHN